MRIDAQGDPYVLEINSLPSLGEHGSYVAASEAVGLDFPALVNRLVEVAAAPYGANIRTNSMILLSNNITDNLFLQ